MYESVAVACQIISSVSLLANIYLAYLYFRCPVNNLNSYKHFFLGTALQNLLFSTCFILIAPVMMSRDFAYILVAYGPLREKNKGQALIALYCLVFGSSMALTANTFIYRYLQICKPQLFNSLLCRRNVMLGMFCNGVIIAFWMANVRMVFWPNSSFLNLMDDHILLNTGLHGDQLALLGASLRAISALDITLCASLVLLMVVLAAVITYTAHKIETALKNAIFSSTLRQLHRKMFTLLLLEAACPFGFLHVPFFVIVVIFFGGLTLDHIVASLSSILMALFPLLSPIIIIGFLKDYRRHLFELLRIRRPRSDASPIPVRPIRTNTT